MAFRTCLLFLACMVICEAFIGSGDDAYMKKYAIRKVWESCFGSEVVKQIRQEKRAAIAKCRVVPTLPTPPSISTSQLESRPETEVNLPENVFPVKKRPTQVQEPYQQSFDPNKLQALLGFKLPNGYNNHVQQTPYNPFLNAFPSYQTPQYPLFQPNVYQQQAYPFYAQPSQQAYPFYPYGYFGNNRHRLSRDLQGQLDLEALHRAIGSKSENVSCQLQELGYLDSRLEPDYEKIALRVERLPVEEELRRDMLDGLEFCKRFSQCMPDMRKDGGKFSKDQDKQMFFFSCYKHKKLEACLMKDVRERFMTDDPLTQDDLSGDDLRSLPRSRKAKMPSDEDTDFL